ncbi:MAG: MMPL family transporter [Planctomycetes bacterium]|nr:MMPL family transporter [Planctomycetota bacterium]
MSLEALFGAMLRRRALATAVLAVACGLSLAGVSRLRTDASIEHMFPVRDPAREVCDRYRAAFPYEDARAVVLVEAADLWTPEGLERLRLLEEGLRRLPRVADVRGPLSVDDVVGDETGISLEPLFPPGERSGEALEARVRRAREDPLFAHRLAHPDRPVAAVEVGLQVREGSRPEDRAEFHRAATALLDERRGDWGRLVLTGIPVIRADYIVMVNKDAAVLLPLALLGVLAILVAAYRSARTVAAATLTIVASVVWTLGLMGAVGVPVAVLSSFSPIVVLIISVSDTVHVVNDFHRRHAAGRTRLEALAAACAESAVPCLLTELTIAAGFVTMGLVNIVAIFEFGMVTAAGMLLTWAANMSVLPLALSLGPEAAPAPAGRPPALLGALSRFLGWVERQVTLRPARVAVVAATVVGLSLAAGSRVRTLHYVFDDLWPDSPLVQRLRYAEEVHGGVVPLAIYLEPGSSGADALAPEALRFLDRAEARLETLPGVRNAQSPASFLRKAHRLLAGPVQAEADGGLPPSREAAAQELEFIDDGRLLRDVLSFDRTRAAALAHLPDMPSYQVRALVADLEAWVRAEAPPGYRAHVTGVLAIADRVTTLLTAGLARSLGAAVLVTLLVFGLVLRSARLAVVGLVPNLAPVAVLLALMGLAGIPLRPSTVLVFSMVLVIADDDTIQFLARFRGRYLELRGRGVEAAHREASLAVLRETGLPMFVTSTSVAFGFLILCLSRFQGTAFLGLVAGLTLFVAIFADVFLTPVLLAAWRPPVGPREGSP